MIPSVSVEKSMNQGFATALGDPVAVLDASSVKNLIRDHIEIGE